MLWIRIQYNYVINIISEYNVNPTAIKAMFRQKKRKNLKKKEKETDNDNTTEHV